MRRRFAAAFAAITVWASAAAVANARTASAAVRVTLTVADTCTIGAPVRLTVDASGRLAVSLNSVLSACSSVGVIPALHVESDSGVGGAYVATIDF